MHAKLVTFLILVLGTSAALQPGEADVLSTDSEDKYFLGRVLSERSLMSMPRAPDSIEGGAVFELGSMIVTPKSEGTRRKDRALTEILSVDASSAMDPDPQRLRGATVKH